MEKHEGPFADQNKAVAFREMFLWVENRQYWTLSKKGNMYVRDFGCTYTLASKPEGFVAVVVGTGGARKDFGPFETEEEAAKALWPEGALRPIDPTL